MTPRSPITAARRLARALRARRAFALPLVVLLVLAAGLSVGLLMDRHGTSYRAMARQVGNYKNHHRAAGIQECVLRWLDTARGKLETSLDNDGLAFTLEVRGRGEIRVYFRDAQGALLTETTQLVGRKREIIEDAKFLLDQLPPEGRIDGLFRPVGPAEVSLASAPAVVIQALCIAVTGDQSKGMFAATAILQRRGDGDGRRPEGSSIQTALAQAPLSDDERRELASIFITTPKLYEVTAVTVNSTGRILDRSAGLYLVDESRNETFKQGGSFLTWDELPVDQP
ncbi:MAG: hypothetical protein K2W85_12835 [Phycisphaerales bacterium]|nr:hypothetical protein [Phycisphaerales bacterium]